MDTSEALRVREKRKHGTLMFAVATLVLIVVLIGVGLVINLYLYTHHAMSSAPTTASVDELFARWNDTDADVW